MPKRIAEEDRYYQVSVLIEQLSRDGESMITVRSLVATEYEREPAIVAARELLDKL